MRKLITIMLVAGVLPSLAASIQLEQGGWTDGAGPLRVSFTGQDGNADGILLLSELTAFSATWETPAGTVDVWRLPDVEPDGFVFENTGDYLFFVRNPRFSLVSSAFEGEALASVFDAFLFPVANTIAPASAVPEPGSGMLLAIGIAVLCFDKARRLTDKQLANRHATGNAAECEIRFEPKSRERNNLI